MSSKICKQKTVHYYIYIGWSMVRYKLHFFILLLMNNFDVNHSALFHLPDTIQIVNNTNHARKRSVLHIWIRKYFKKPTNVTRNRHYDTKIPQ